MKHARLAHDEVVVLHGVADRDPNELVFMIFWNFQEKNEFVAALPGNYKTRIMSGVVFADIEVSS